MIPIKQERLSTPPQTHFNVTHTRKENEQQKQYNSQVAIEEASLAKEAQRIKELVNSNTNIQRKKPRSRVPVPTAITPANNFEKILSKISVSPFKNKKKEISRPNQTGKGQDLNNPIPSQAPSNPIEVEKEVDNQLPVPEAIPPEKEINTAARTQDQPTDPLSGDEGNHMTLSFSTNLELDFDEQQNNRMRDFGTLMVPGSPLSRLDSQVSDPISPHEQCIVKVEPTAQSEDHAQVWALRLAEIERRKRQKEEKERLERERREREDEERVKRELERKEQERKELTRQMKEKEMQEHLESIRKDKEREKETAVTEPIPELPQEPLSQPPQRKIGRPKKKATKPKPPGRRKTAPQAQSATNASKERQESNTADISQPASDPKGTRRSPRLRRRNTVSYNEEEDEDYEEGDEEEEEEDEMGDGPDSQKKKTPSSKKLRGGGASQGIKALSGHRRISWKELKDGLVDLTVEKPPARKPPKKKVAKPKGRTKTTQPQQVIPSQYSQSIRDELPFIRMLEGKKQKIKLMKNQLISQKHEMDLAQKKLEIAIQLLNNSQKQLKKTKAEMGRMKLQMEFERLMPKQQKNRNKMAHYSLLQNQKRNSSGKNGKNYLDFASLASDGGSEEEDFAMNQINQRLLLSGAKETKLLDRQSLTTFDSESEQEALDISELIEYQGVDGDKSNQSMHQYDEQEQEEDDQDQEQSQEQEEQEEEQGEEQEEYQPMQEYDEQEQEEEDDKDQDQEDSQEQEDEQDQEDNQEQEEQNYQEVQEREEEEEEEKEYEQEEEALEEEDQAEETDLQSSKQENNDEAEEEEENEEYQEEEGMNNPYYEEYEEGQEYPSQSEGEEAEVLDYDGTAAAEEQMLEEVEEEEQEPSMEDEQDEDFVEIVQDNEEEEEEEEEDREKQSKSKAKSKEKKQSEEEDFEVEEDEVEVVETQTKKKPEKNKPKPKQRGKAKQVEKSLESGEEEQEEVKITEKNNRNSKKRKFEEEKPERNAKIRKLKETDKISDDNTTEKSVDIQEKARKIEEERKLPGVFARPIERLKIQELIRKYIRKVKHIPFQDVVEKFQEENLNQLHFIIPTRFSKTVDYVYENMEYLLDDKNREKYSQFILEEFYELIWPPKYPCKVWDKNEVKKLRELVKQYYEGICPNTYFLLARELKKSISSVKFYLNHISEIRLNSPSKKEASWKGKYSGTTTKWSAEQFRLFDHLMDESHFLPRTQIDIFYVTSYFPERSVGSLAIKIHEYKNTLPSPIIDFEIFKRLVSRKTTRISDRIWQTISDAIKIQPERAKRRRELFVWFLPKHLRNFGFFKTNEGILDYIQNTLIPKFEKQEAENEEIGDSNEPKEVVYLKLICQFDTFQPPKPKAIKKSPKK